MAVVAAAALLLGVAAGRWSAGGDHSLGVDRSPDGSAQVEFRAPDRAQRAWLRVTGSMADMPGTVRVSSSETGDVGPASPVVDLSGIGRTRWSPATVDVGTALTYDRAARRWTYVQ